jgi:uncharacterized membrane protein
MKRKTSTGYLVRLAVLAAILLLLEVTGLGMIKTPGLEFTIMQVPVIIGAIVMGPTAGGILGGIFGCISFWECFGKSQFGVILMGINPFFTFLVCVPTRILMGVCCGWIFKALYRIDKTKLLSFGAASLRGALLNTLFFMTALLALFFHTDYIQGLANGMHVLAFAVAFVGVQGLLEALICAVAGTAISKALHKALHL